MIISSCVLWGKGVESYIPPDFAGAPNVLREDFGEVLLVNAEIERVPNSVNIIPFISTIRGKTYDDFSSIGISSVVETDSGKPVR